MARQLSSSKLFACTTVLVATAIAAFDVDLESQSVFRPPETRVIFDFKKAIVTETDSIDLIRTVAQDVPVIDWPSIVTRKPITLQALVDEVYGLGLAKPLSDVKAAPSAVRLLEDLLRQTNQLSSDTIPIGSQLRVVPLSFPGAVRSTNAVALSPEHASDVILFGNRLPRGIPATGKSVDRSDGVVGLLTAGTATKLANSGEGSARPNRQLVVELLQDKGCVNPAAAVRTSPYFDAAIRRLTAARAELQAKAATKKLAIIDFNFRDFHGRYVRAAALSLLDAFELRPVLEGSIIPIELQANFRHDPTKKDAGSLLETVEAYARAQSLPEEEIHPASHYLATVKSAERTRQITIPAVLLQAAVWQQVRSQHWLNLSWTGRGDDGTLPGRIDEALDAADAFVAVAAGNGGTLRSDQSPQSAAASSQRFVNVTSGFDSGRVSGTESGSGNKRVHLSAPGCGFMDGNEPLTEQGSSFSAPFVAAAAWLKHLLDETRGNDIGAMLISSSTLLPNQDKVASGGFFDPARLLAGEKSHYLSADGTIVPLDRPYIETDTCGTIEPFPGRPGMTDVILYKETTNGKISWLVRRRTPVPSFPFVMAFPPCKVEQFRLMERGREKPVLGSKDGVPDAAAALFKHISL